MAVARIGDDLRIGYTAVGDTRSLATRLEKAAPLPEQRPAGSQPAAARSASTRARSRRTRPPGIDASPVRSRASIALFDAPVTSQRI